MTQNAKTCRECEHWFSDECFRYPPQVVLWPNDNHHPVIYTPMNGRPYAHGTQRACGEFSARVAALLKESPNDQR